MQTKLSFSLWITKGMHFPVYGRLQVSFGVLLFFHFQFIIYIILKYFYFSIYYIYTGSDLGFFRGLLLDRLLVTNDIRLSRRKIPDLWKT